MAYDADYDSNRPGADAPSENPTKYVVIESYGMFTRGVLEVVGIVNVASH